MKTETNLKQNCFETVLFQFHFSCADSLSAPTYDKTSRLASADFRRRYSISCISRPLTELTQSIKLTTHGWRFQISLDGREFDWHCQGTTTSIRFCEIVCRCPGTRLVRTSAIVCWTVRLNLTSPRGINIFLHSTWCSLGQTVHLQSLRFQLFWSSSLAKHEFGISQKLVTIPWCL